MAIDQLAQRGSPGHVASVDLASLGGEVRCITAANGTRFVFTDSALFMIDRDGLEELVAGHPTEKGFKDGVKKDARFRSPYGITVDSDGNVLVADTLNHALRKVTRQGAVSTLAGTSVSGFADGVGEARFNHPMGVAINAQGTIFVTDSQNHCLRQVILSDGVSASVTTLAGVGGNAGFADASGPTARFNMPCGLALDMDGNLVVSDLNNCCIRKVTTTEGRVTTVAGQAGQRGYADGEGAAARFKNPFGVVVDGSNNILVADTSSHCIRMISGDKARVTTVAGSTEAGDADGTGVLARFNNPVALALDEDSLLVLELSQHRLRVVKAFVEEEICRPCLCL